MNEIDVAKQLAAERVVLLVSQGYTISKACEEVGISRWLYAKYLAKSGDIEQFLKERKKELEDDYLNVFEARRKAIAKLIKKVEGEDISTGELLSLEDRLATRETQLEKQIGYIDKPFSNTEDNATKFLKRLQGPNLRHGKAVITMTERTISVGDSNEDVIDGEVLEPD